MTKLQFWIALVKMEKMGRNEKKKPNKETD